MERVLIDLWFCNDYYDILDYTSVDYKYVYSYEKQYVQNLKGQPQNQSLRVEKKQPISKENFEVVKKDQDLQQVIELKIKDTTCQKFDEDVKEKKVELIVDNDRNQEMVIIENIEEYSIQLRLNMRMSPELTILRFRLIF